MLVTQRPALIPSGGGIGETQAPPIVHVVEDEPSIQALFRSMSRVGGFEVASYDSKADFLSALDDSRVGCIVLDLNLPDGSGIEVLEELAQRECRMPVVFMSGMADVSAAVAAFRLGSLDFVEKPFEIAAMIDAVQRAISTDRARRTDSATHDALARRFHRLTPRETEVMEMVVRGSPNKEIAARLGLSPKTVEVHRANVMRKTEANSVAELVRMHVALSN